MRPEQRRDCPVCHCVEWDDGFQGHQLTLARSYHLAEWHSEDEILDAFDELWSLIGDITASTVGALVLTVRHE